MTKLEKIRRWEYLKEHINGNVARSVVEFHSLSQDLYGAPKNAGPHKVGWSLEDTARELRKSVSYIRGCQEIERRKSQK